jgi:broad specificity phosphatase PhoE
VTRLLLLRHAESEWNALGRWQGWADPPLSEDGNRQAGDAGRLLKPLGFTAVASSDLERARRTAELAAADMGLTEPVRIDAGLREYDVGDWSGLTRPEIEARWPSALEEWRHGRLAAPPGGENRTSFVARIVAAVTRVGAAPTTGRVLVITHGGVISSLARSLGAGETRVAHLAGRWFDTQGEGLRLGEAMVLFDPDARTEAAEGEGLELSSPNRKIGDDVGLPGPLPSGS